MTSYSKKLSFMVPLTKEETAFAKRLLKACKSVVRRATWDANKTKLESIYKKVPADLRDHVRNIAPNPMCGIGIVASYEEADEDDEAGMWVRHDESANIEFLPLWLREIIRKFGRPDAIGFEWCCDCASPVLGAFGGGGCVVTKDGWNWLDTGDWVAAELSDPGGKHANNIASILRKLVVDPDLRNRLEERDQTIASD
jgi:hypothetical protein